MSDVIDLAQVRREFRQASQGAHYTLLLLRDDVSLGELAYLLGPYIGITQDRVTGQLVIHRMPQGAA